MHWSLSIMDGIINRDFRYIHLLLAMQALELIYGREKGMLEETCRRNSQGYRPLFFRLLIKSTKGESFFEKNGLDWVKSENILKESYASHRKLNYCAYKGNWEARKEGNYILQAMCPEKIAYLLDNFLEKLRERLNKRNEVEKVIFSNAINLLLSHRDVGMRKQLYPGIYLIEFPKGFEESQPVFNDVVKNLFEEGYGLEYEVDGSVYYEYNYRGKIQLRRTYGGRITYYVLIYDFLNYPDKKRSVYYFSNLKENLINEQQNKEDEINFSNVGIKLFLDKAYEENEEEKVYYLLLNEVAFKIKFEILPSGGIKLRKFKLLSEFDIGSLDLEEIKVNMETECSILEKLGDLKNTKDFKAMELRFRKNSIHILFRLDEINFHLRCSYNTSYGSMSFYLKCLHRAKLDCFCNAVRQLNLKKIPLIIDDSYPYKKDLLEIVRNCSIPIEDNAKYSKFDIQSILLMMVLNKGIRVFKQSRRNFLLLNEELTEELST